MKGCCTFREGRHIVTADKTWQNSNASAAFSKASARERSPTKQYLWRHFLLFSLRTFAGARFAERSTDNCAKFGWNLSTGSGEKFYTSFTISLLKFVNIFSQFDYYLSLKKGTTLNMNKLESPLPRMYYAKFGWNWSTGSGEKIYTAINGFFTISLLSRFEKMHGPLFEQTWNPFTQECLVWSLVEICPVFLEKKIKMCTVKTTGTTIKFWSAKNTITTRSYVEDGTSL